MGDRFFTQKICDRCRRPLTGGRTMSMLNTDCICMECADAEKSDPRYAEAVRTEREEIMRGNRNFKGILG